MKNLRACVDGIARRGGELAGRPWDRRVLVWSA
jgi:hypothetical protein